MTTDSRNTPLYTELQEMLTTVGATLGGDETLEELAEMCESMFGDLV